LCFSCKSRSSSKNPSTEKPQKLKIKISRRTALNEEKDQKSSQLEIL
jgi:predicted component of type VI protein secretion system